MERTLLSTIKVGEESYAVKISNLVEHIILNKVLVEKAKECGFKIKKDKSDFRVSPIEGIWSEKDAVENIEILVECIERGLKVILNNG